MNPTSAAARERITFLREELSEVTIEISKIERFGLDSYHPAEPHISNAERLAREIGDLLGIIDMMSSKNDIDSRVINNASHLISHRIFTGQNASAQPSGNNRAIITALQDIKIPDREYHGPKPSNEHLLDILNSTIAHIQIILSPLPVSTPGEQKSQLTGTITSLLWVIDLMKRVNILDYKIITQYRNQKAERISRLPNLQAG